MSEKMNVYQKIAKARTLVSVKKNGVNKHGGYKYYQLNDIYSEARKVFAELGILTVSRITKQPDTVTLTYKYNTYDANKQKQVNFKDVETLLYLCKVDVINVDNPDDKTAYVVEIPYSQQDGASFAQSFGGTSTYAEKYIYLKILMLDDTQDDDAVNTHGKDDVTQQNKKTEGQRLESKGEFINHKLELSKLLKDGGLNAEQIAEFVREHTGKSKISDKEADELYKKIISGEIVITIDPEDDISMQQSAPPEQMKKHRRV